MCGFYKLMIILFQNYCLPVLCVMTFLGLLLIICDVLVVVPDCLKNTDSAVAKFSERYVTVTEKKY